MKINIKNLFLFATLVALSSCGPKQIPKVISGDYNYETECVRKDLDGSMVVRVWGKGLSQEEAELDARKKAVDDLLFRGIRGNDECSMNPIISNPNAREEIEKKLLRFYKDKGKFKKYVSKTRAEKLDTKDIGSGKKAYGFYLTVDTKELKKLFGRKLNTKR